MHAQILSKEWERAELLAEIVRDNRQSKSCEPEKINRLSQIQEEVLVLRSGGQWQAVCGSELNSMEQDVIACALGPVVSPRLAWLYQTLQGRQDSPYPSIHFIQELLSITPEDISDFYRVFERSSALLQRGLISLSGDGPFATVNPSPKTINRLLGTLPNASSPPGTERVQLNCHWDDLILPEIQKTRLREFLSYISCSSLIEDKWNGRAAHGPVALFSGSSGTGKTFAAGIIANELGWPLYRVDLGRLVSKYIGETEKNLNALFDAAHGQSMVLQFDEADALFSKRGEVREARDRYANLEVSHLLSRIESHRGPCILTTNLREQMDIAFARRFQVVIDFPRPDVAARLALWQSSLPPQIPMNDDVDLEIVAKNVKLNGGSIRNAAHHAAVIAAAGPKSLTQYHLSVAVWRELGKEGRPVSINEIGDLGSVLQRGAA